MISDVDMGMAETATPLVRSKVAHDLPSERGCISNGYDPGAVDPHTEHGHDRHILFGANAEGVK